MRRLVVVAGLVLLGAACEAGMQDPPPFPSTEFLDLEEVSTTGAGFDHALAGDGRYLIVQWDGYTEVFDLEGASAGGFASPAQTRQGAAAVAVAGDLVVFPRGPAGVDVTRMVDGGARFEPVVSSTIPAIDLHVGEDRVALWDGTRVWVVERDTFLGQPTTPEDAVLTLDVALQKAAAVQGDALWVSSDAVGTLGYDISDPGAPREIAMVGDWFAYEMITHGDLLLLAHGYDGGAYDVSDPAAPVALGPLYGGQGMSVHGGYYYGVDRSSLFIVRLDPGGVEPVHFREMISDVARHSTQVGDCVDAVAGPHGVFVACSGTLSWLGPNTP